MSRVLLQSVLVCLPVFASPLMAEPREPPGTRHEVRLGDIDTPRREESVVNIPTRIDRKDRDGLSVPAGFRAEVFADDLSHPRNLLPLPGGDLLVAESNIGQITLLRDLDGDGKADLARPYAEGFERPFGLVLAEEAVLVADVRAVWRLEHRPGALKAGPRKPLTRPGALGQGGNHWTRNLVLAPGGKYFFVAVGSRANIAEEPLPHASIQRFAIDGSGQTTIASGLRNPVGMAFYPGTEHLFAVVNERDNYGDTLVPDFLARIEDGDFFGWPYAFIGRRPDPRFGDKRPDLVERTKLPDMLFAAHSAPIGLVFYDGDMFPAEFRGDAFVSLRGSWNAKAPRGYSLVHVPFEGGRPVGHYETFASGFWTSGEDRAQVIGRPAGLAVGADGSLFVADDVGKAVWRMTYDGVASPNAGQP